MEASRYAYLHGFASGPASRKGVELARRLAPRGVRLALPDLNVPSFARLTYAGALGAIDAFDRAGSGPWRLLGSSMGGYLAARWAELHPDRVDRLVLLCPGFDLVRRWPAMLGADAMARWRAEGTHPFPDASGVPTPVAWTLVEEAALHPPYPEVPCPTLIVHGTRDEVVPIESSRADAPTRRNGELGEVDDDHGLVSSLDRIEAEVVRFLGLTQRARL